MADNLDFPVVVYEKDRELPPCQSRQILADYQANKLSGHYLRINGNYITADGKSDDQSSYLQCTYFKENYNQSDWLVCICDVKQQHVLAYGKDNAGKEGFYVKGLELKHISKIKDAQNEGIVFVMTSLDSDFRCFQPWKSAYHPKPYLAFDDNGDVMDQASSKDDTTIDRRKLFRLLPA